MDIARIILAMDIGPNSAKAYHDAIHEGLIHEHHRSTRLLAIVNGRGGADDTSLLANSVFELTKLRRNMLAMNAVLNLGNLDFMMPSTFRYTLEQIFQEAKSLQQIIVGHKSRTNGQASRTFAQIATAIGALPLLILPGGQVNLSGSSCLGKG